MKRRTIIVFAVLFSVMLAWTPGAAVATSHLAVASQHTTDTDFQNAKELTNMSVSGSGVSADVVAEGPSGSVSITESAAADGYSDTYDIGNISSATAPEVTFTGVLNTESDTDSGTAAPSGSGTITPSGNLEPLGSGGSGEPTLTVSNNNLEEDANTISADGDGSTDSTTAFAEDDESAEMQFRPDRSGVLHQITINTNGFDDSGSATYDIYVTQETEADGNYGEGTLVKSGWSGSLNDPTIEFDTEASVTADTWYSIEFVIQSGTADFRMGVRVDDSVTSNRMSSGGLTQTLLADFDYQITQNINNLDATIDGETHNFGDLSYGDSASAEYDVQLGDSSVSFSGSGSGDVSWSLDYQERTETEDPSLDVNAGSGGGTLSHTGRLGDGNTTTLTGDASWIQDGQNTINLSLATQSADAPATQVGIDYSHDYTSEWKQAVYRSQNHLVSDAEQAAIDLETVTNASVTLTVTDAGSGATINQTTVSSAGNHTLSLSGNSADELEVNVTADRTGQDPQLVMADETILFDASAPTVSLQSPSDGKNLTQSSVTLEAAVNDSDFQTSQGDTVTADFLVKRPNETSFSSAGTDTLTSNGTASLSYDAMLGGEYEWKVETTDSYGETATSSTRNFSTPSELRFVEETDPTTLVDAPVNITVRFFEEGNANVITRTTTDGTVSLTNLSVGSSFIVDAEPSSNYTSRVIRLESLYEQSRVFMLNTSLQSVESRFVLEDPTGQYGSETLLKILKPITINGTTEYRIVYADRFGVEGVTAVLEEGARYQIRVQDPGGTTPDVGPYRADVGETVTVEPGTPTIELGKLSDGWAYGASIENDTINYEYVDATGNTDELTVYTYEKGNRSNQLALNRTYTNPTQVTGSYSLTANQTKKTWVVTFDVDRTTGTYVLTDTVSNTPTLTPAFDEKWQLIVGIGALFISAGMFSVVNVGVGAVLIALEGGFLWYIGFLDGATSAAGVTLALFIAVMANFLSSSR